jgi:2-C-methyl-D-erythritol 4-phosphate cytidylyltransferase
MTKRPSCCAIIVAAGNSTRMALGYSKQFVPLCGIPAIARTLAAFDSADLIDATVVVCRNEDLTDIENCVNKYNYKKVIAVVAGGNTRQQSVMAGIAAAPQDSEYFAIHDGARALITTEEINLSVEDGFQYRASALAVPVKDTIKLIDENGAVISTPDRSLLWAVQTPQVFERSIYQAALAQAQKDDADYTDDCQLAEHNGVKVHLCQGEYTNLKLTTADDVDLAEMIITKRESEV